MMFTKEVKDSKLTIEKVVETAEKMLSRRVNDMLKIKVKCWVYHSESRVKNGNEPFHFDIYAHRLGKQTYLEYIDFNLIDCEDIGGKEKAIEIINHWFA